MKLIKCNHCHRPYYDSNALCPYCGHDTQMSINNVLTRPISDPEAHRRMEHMLSPDYDPREFQPVVRATELIEQPKLEPEAPKAQEPVAEPVVSETAKGRADAIAAIKNEAKEEHIEHVASVEPDVETVPLPKKRRRWIWIVIVLLILAVLLAAIAAFCYLKWDFVKDKVPFLNKTEQVVNEELIPADDETTIHADEILNQNMETIEDEAIDMEESEDPTEEVLEDLSLI